ncbi:MAG: PQQ-dependent sugar dehydrogenase [Chthoniobacterales bacterium]|nr:PQQ-dependent sugar dehydrogenase [Chthoniobacterales bacterium]
MSLKPFFAGRTFAGAASLALFFTSLTSLHAQAVPGLSATRVATGFVEPVFVTAPPGDRTRLFVVQLTGQIKILNLKTGATNATPFLDISSEISLNGEEGLLGLAFDQNYAANRRFYVNYVGPGGSFGQGVSHIAQFRVSTDPNVADPASERILLSYDQPESNHNGGWIGFSPRAGDEGNLYIATGDGGASNDAGTGHIEPGGNAQNLTTLLGKMLRIHIGTRLGTYTIPANNPFAGSTVNRQEIFCYGLRNPFRDSFDRQTGNLYIGDVGQDSREEVDAQLAANPGGGENYGWRVREGTIQNPAYPNDPVPPNALDPIYDYPHTVGVTVIGGYVYRGKRIPSLKGVYVFADYLGPDYTTGRIWTLNVNGNTATNFQDITTELFPTPVGNYPLNNPTSLGEDASGELYIVAITSGDIFKILGPSAR